MEIRLRTTGEVLSEAAFRQSNPDTSFPTAITAVTLDGFDADVVMEGPQASGGEFWQYSVRDGVELINGKWYTRYSFGPVFTDIPASDDAPAKTAAEQQAEYIAKKTAQRNQALRDSVISSAQQRLDDAARAHGYDSIISLCTYATSSVPRFQAEGQYGVELRDATWSALYQILVAVESGERPIPAGYDEIEPELPAIVWPV